MQELESLINYLLDKISKSPFQKFRDLPDLRNILTADTQAKFLEVFFYFFIKRQNLIKYQEFTIANENYKIKIDEFRGKEIYINTPKKKALDFFQRRI